MKRVRNVGTSKTLKQRGDTLIEVTIAMAVLGLILASTMTVINRSLLGVMNAVERTAIRGEVDAQMELLRYVFDTQTGINEEVADQVVASTGSGNVADKGCSSGNGGFYLKINTGDDAATKPVTLTQYRNVDNVANGVWGKPAAGNGIWIEGRKTDGGELNDYIDFYVRACWSPYASREIGQGRMESIMRVSITED